MVIAEGVAQVSIEKLLPTALMSIDLLAGAVYLCCGDWKRCIYWTSAAILTWTVTF